MRAALIAAAIGLTVAGCGSEGTTSPKPTTVVGATPKAPVVKGNATAGKQVFASQGCGSCHTYEPAGSKGTVGPNLTTALKGKSPDFIHESIVNPSAEIAKGYPPNVMPQTYGSQLSDKQLADLVSFLSQK
jgi:cytochrome c oxidase subunit II